MWPALRLGDLTISPPVALAPLAGYSSLPLRLLSRRAGAGVVYTEMVSALGLVHGQPGSQALLASCPGERPLGVQLFGAQPEALARATQMAVEHGADFVDLNLGCAVRKVLKTGAGAALLGRPDLAVELVRGMVASAQGRPVTVKLRAGLTTGDQSWLDLAVRLVEAGAVALALHGRTAEQGFRGECSLADIAALVREVPVPVLGSGDVASPQAAERMLAETGCAGVMIGRAALGNPWLFTQVAARLRGESPLPEPSVAARVAVALCHAQMAAVALGERRWAGPVRP